MVSSAVTGMVQPVTKVAGSVGSQSGQDNSGNVDFARIMNSSVRNDVMGIHQSRLIHIQQLHQIHL